MFSILWTALGTEGFSVLFSVFFHKGFEIFKETVSIFHLFL